MQGVVAMGHSITPTQNLNARLSRREQGSEGRRPAPRSSPATSPSAIRSSAPPVRIVGVAGRFQRRYLVND